MKKIGLTQRVTRVDNYNEQRDSLDQRWWPLMHALGYIPIPLPNLPAADAPYYVQSLRLSGIILTGGNSLIANDRDAAPERDAFETAILTWALQENLPVVGVCRGLQMINHYFGGSLMKVSAHVATQHAVKFCGRWQSLKDRTVNSYHDWGILPQHLGQHLLATAHHSDGTVEAAIHDEKKIAGIMWHPERETPHAFEDSELLRSLLQ